MPRGYAETYRRSIEQPEEFWAEAAEAIDADTDDQSLLPWLAERILVDVQKSLGELVDLIVGPGLRHPSLAVKDRVGLGVMAVLHGDGDAGIAAQVLRLLSPLRSVEEDFVTVHVHPHHSDLRVAALVQCHHVPVGLVLQELLH